MDSTEGGLTVEVIIISMAIVFIFALVVILFFVVYQKRLLHQERVQQEKELQYQKELLRASIDGQEKERLRIAKDLHDEVGTMLTTTKMYTSQFSVEMEEEKRNSLSTKMNELLGATIQSVREISHDLRPVVLEKLGLHEAIKSLSETLDEAGEIRVDYIQNGAAKLSKEQSINLYRIVQELINNSLKHGNAQNISIKMSTSDKELMLNYSDDGIGMDFEKLKDKKGIGLKNIESRLSVLLGEIKYDKGTSGFHVQIKVPCKP